jgi:hypothetical protein
MMEPKHRSQVEYELERPLTDEELVVVADLAALPPSHLDVVERLYRRDPIAAIFYLRAVTNDIDPSTLRNYVHGFDSILAERDPDRGLLARRLCESKLGRALTADEMVGTTSLQSLTRAQRDVARALAVQDRGLARAYLHLLVPSASWDDWDGFLDKLPRA